MGIHSPIEGTKSILSSDDKVNIRQAISRGDLSNVDIAVLCGVTVRQVIALRDADIAAEKRVERENARFERLMRQRRVTVIPMEEIVPSGNFHETPEGQEVLARIRQSYKAYVPKKHRHREVLSIADLRD